MLYKILHTGRVGDEETFEVPDEYDGAMQEFIAAIPILKPGYQVSWVARPVYVEEEGRRGFMDLPNRLGLNNIYFLERLSRSKNVRSYPHPIFEGKWLVARESTWQLVSPIVTDYIATRCIYEETTAIMKAELYLRFPEMCGAYASFVPPVEPTPVEVGRYDRPELV